MVFGTGVAGNKCTSELTELLLKDFFAMRKVAADVLAALILVSLSVPATVQSKNGHVAAAAAELGKFVRCNSDGFVNVISVQGGQGKNL